MSQFKFNFFDNQVIAAAEATCEPKSSYCEEIIEIKGNSVQQCPAFTTNIMSQIVMDNHFSICTTPSKENLKEIATFFDSIHCPIEHSSQLEIWLNGACDVIPGVYEGGFKLWEGSVDLLTHLIHNSSVIFSNLSVLDLGCGVGLLGILALQRDAATVVFQDCNLEVLQCSTIPHCILNKTCLERATFVPGPWKTVKEYFVKSKLNFDVILSSETIYNKANYSILCEILHQTLTSRGVAYFAAKQTYFGLSGSTHEFMEFILQFGNLECSIIEHIDASSPRQILLVKKL